MVLDIGAILASLVTLLWKNYKEKVHISLFSNNIEKYFKVGHISFVETILRSILKQYISLFCNNIKTPLPKVIPLMENYKIMKPKPE